jgi:hypothetical protein
MYGCSNELELGMYEYRPDKVQVVVDKQTACGTKEL